MLWIFAATATAVAFAASSMVAFGAARELGGIVFSFLRTSLASAGFLIAIAIVGWDWSLSAGDLLLLGASGLSGVFLADSLRYAALARLGPRINSLFQTASVPFSLVCGAVLLDQRVTGASLLGTLVVFAGIVIAVAFSKRPGATAWEGDPHRRTLGILLALASALAFSVSLLAAAPVMERGADPLSATAVRAVAGSLATLFPVMLSRGRRAQVAGLSRRQLAQVLASAILGTGLGLSAQLYALASGPVGIVSALSSTSPVLLVPLVWIVSRQRPTLAAWIGAVTAVGGTALIFLGEA